MLALAAVIIASPTAAVQAQVPPQEVLAIWYRMTLELVRHTPTYTPPVASRSYAYIGIAAYEAVLNDAEATPYFKARAALEQTHLHLAGGDAVAARLSVTKASDQLKTVSDAELPAMVKLSLAAVEFQSDAYEPALAAFAEAERLAGPRRPGVQIEAILGQARVLERQGKATEAIAQLEPLTARSDVGAEGILTVAKARYWRLKRTQAEAAQPQPAEAKPADVKPAEAKPVEVPAVVAPAAPALDAK